MKSLQQDKRNPEKGEIRKKMIILYEKKKVGKRTGDIIWTERGE